MRYSLGHKLVCAVGIGAPPRKWFHLLLHYICVHGVTHESTEFWNGCCASQERINVVLSVVPTALHVFFQPLSSHLAHPGFNKQCGQCEQWDCALWAGSAIQFGWFTPFTYICIYQWAFSFHNFHELWNHERQAFSFSLREVPLTFFVKFVWWWWTLSFCLSVKLLMSPSDLNKSLASISCIFFLCISLTISCHSLLTCRVSAEKSADSLWELPCV